MTIRPATVADGPAVSALVQASYRHYLARLGKPPAPMLLDYHRELAEHPAWVVPRPEGIRGFVLVYRHPDHWLVDVLAVHPDSQGTGLGSQLLRYVEQRATEAGAAEVRLFTHEKMTENVAYYPRRGYAETDRRTEDGYARVFFTKHLDR